MTNERFEFKDGRLHWISDEDTLIVDAWPSLRCEYIQGSATEPNEYPDELHTATSAWRSQKTLDRLLYTPRVKLVLNREYPDYDPSDPRYYMCPGYLDRILRQRIAAVTEECRDVLTAFYATFPERYLNEIIRYERENVRIAKAFALDHRLYELSVANPALFILLIYFAHHVEMCRHCQGWLPPISHDLHRISDLKVENPEEFLRACAALNPLDILEYIGLTVDVEIFAAYLNKWIPGTSVFHFVSALLFIVSFRNTDGESLLDYLSVVHPYSMHIHFIFYQPQTLALRKSISESPTTAHYSNRFAGEMYMDIRRMMRSRDPSTDYRELCACENHADMRSLYKSYLPEYMRDWPNMDYDLRLPVDTPAVRPFRNTQEYKQAILENLCPGIASQYQTTQINRGYLMYRVVEPVKGILSYMFADDDPTKFVAILLFLDFGERASYAAGTHIWLKACEESDWTGWPTDLKQTIINECRLPPDYYEAEFENAVPL